MIPTYNPRAEYLEETLKSVLQQDPGPDQMQIEVVDDASPNGAPTELSSQAGRRARHRSCASRAKSWVGRNAWNRCIERARGRMGSHPPPGRSLCSRASISR